MPGSSPDFKPEIKDFLLSTFTPRATILDIGAGQGTYSDLLRDYFYNIDALEIHLPYIELYDLTQKYRKVFNVDCMNFLYSNYDIFILGDIVEHLSVAHGQLLIEKLYPLATELIVSVPYLCQQGAAHENEYEIHLQDDLTSEIMTERYPLLKLWKHNSKIGIYLKS